VDDRWFHHSSPTLPDSDNKVEEVGTVVWNSVIRPRHVLHLLHNPLLPAGRLHPHITQQLHSTALSTVPAVKLQTSCLTKSFSPMVGQKVLKVKGLRPTQTDTSWISTGPNWSPMMRSVLVLGSHSRQTLYVDTVCLSMVTSTAPTLGRITTTSSNACGVETEDRLTQTDLAENGGDWPATNEPWPGVSQTMCTGQRGLATTRDNGYVHDKPLKKKGLYSS